MDQKKKSLSRKTFLKQLTVGGLGVGLGSCILGDSAPQPVSDSNNTDQSARYRWRMVTTWPPDFPILGEAATAYAELVNKMSGGRIEIKVYGAGELVPALEAFDTVRQNTAEVGCGAPYYWAGKSPATQLFSAVPFGMNAQQVNSWLFGGGGYELWKEVYADFGLVPIPGGNTGIQMGGWFNKEIQTVSDLKGLKMRIPGLGGAVIERAGGAAVLVAGSEIYTSLERGVIDATEWVGPFHDYRMGFSRIAKYYYYPGWHEPGSQLEFFINKASFEQLPSDLQQICISAGLELNSRVLAQCETQNAIALRQIQAEGSVDIRPFPRDVLETLRHHSEGVLHELRESDALTKKVYDAYTDFQQKIGPWNQVSENAYVERLFQLK